MLFHTSKTSFSVNVLKIAIFVFFQVSQVTAVGVCNRQVYGSPEIQSCETALVAMPRDRIVQYFVEQQLRRQPGTNWVAFADPRLPGQKQKVVQVPKWWSSCPYRSISSLCVQALTPHKVQGHHADCRG